MNHFQTSSSPMETLKLLQIRLECRSVQDLILYCTVWRDRVQHHKKSVISLYKYAHYSICLIKIWFNISTLDGEKSYFLCLRQVILSYHRKAKFSGSHSSRFCGVLWNLYLCFSFLFHLNIAQKSRSTANQEVFDFFPPSSPKKPTFKKDPNYHFLLWQRVEVSASNQDSVANTCRFTLWIPL